MTGYYYFIGGEVETAIPTVIGWVTQEGTFGEEGGKFMWSGRGKVGVT